MRTDKFQILQFEKQDKIIGVCDNVELFRSMGWKVEIALMIANLRNEDDT